MRYKRDEDVQLSKHFHLSEFECKCGKCPETLVSEDLINSLEALREDLEAPITINSGYRCEAHNKAVKGSKTSQHLLGTAVDIRCRTRSPTLIAMMADLYFNGIGEYRNFTHVDVREKLSRWKGKY